MAIHMGRKPPISFAEIPLQPVVTPWIPSEVTVHMLRLDALHPLISGNKWFKLKYNLEQAHGNTLVTLGGPWSNHLHAVAAACKWYAIPCIGIIRGEKGEQLSVTLQDCVDLGMELQFVSRSLYKDLDAAAQGLSTFPPAYTNPNYYWIPSGGFNEAGVQGAGSILENVSWQDYTHILLPVGTGTTLAGILKATSQATKPIEIIGISALKGAFDIEDKVRQQVFLEDRPFQILHDYHWGGFAKTPLPLVAFMNTFYEQSGIPTDRVYTSKMVFALQDLLQKDTIPSGSRVLMIHTGGLQGNRSFNKGAFVF
jgi:1-aminocyclopropane-1-carboxylate deaminase